MHWFLKTAVEKRTLSEGCFSISGQRLIVDEYRLVYNVFMAVAQNIFGILFMLTGISFGFLIAFKLGFSKTRIVLCSLGTLFGCLIGCIPFFIACLSLVIVAATGVPGHLTGFMFFAALPIIASSVACLLITDRLQVYSILGISTVIGALGGIGAAVLIIGAVILVKAYWALILAPPLLAATLLAGHAISQNRFCLRLFKTNKVYMLDDTDAEYFQIFSQKGIVVPIWSIKKKAVKIKEQDTSRFDYPIREISLNQFLNETIPHLKDRNIRIAPDWKNNRLLDRYLTINRFLKLARPHRLE